MRRKRRKGYEDEVQEKREKEKRKIQKKNQE